MSKRRNVAFSRPEEPSFLKKLKQQVGYKEGPTVDTKREDLGPVSEEDLQDTTEEEPTVVVLQPGDLTAEQAEQLKREAEEAPADLTKPIKFKKPTPKSEELADIQGKTKNTEDTKERKTKKQKKQTPVLSFNQDEEEEEDN